MGGYQGIGGFPEFFQHLVRHGFIVEECLAHHPFRILENRLIVDSQDCLPVGDNFCPFHRVDFVVR